MRVLILTTLFTISALLCTGQSFEGTLTYQVQFEIRPQKIGQFEITKDQIIQKLKESGEYFDEMKVVIKGGDYVKTDNASNQKRIVYLSNENKIYTMQENFEYVVIADAGRVNTLDLNLPEPTIEKIDTAHLVNNVECSLLELSWGKTGTELYFYNSEHLKMDPALFQNHKYEYFNEVLNMTHSYPMEIVKTVSDFMKIRMTLIEVSHAGVDDQLFALPAMTEAEKDYAEMMRKMMGAEVMRIKE